MDSPAPSTPPYTRLAPAPAPAVVPVIVSVADDPDDLEHPRLAACLVTPPSRKKPSISPSPLHLHPNRHHHGGSPQASSLQELLLLSPSRSPCRSRPRARLGAAAVAMVIDDGCVEATTLTPRRKGKSGRALAAAGPLGCASPRNARRARRRLEKEITGRGEEREVGQGDEDGERVRKRRQGRTKAAAAASAASKERLSLVTVPPSSPLPPSISIPDAENMEACSQLDGLRDLILDLVMWRNVAKSTLWFGFGSMFFLSSCFSNNLNFSIISSMSHLGILFLGLAFFRDSVPKRQQIKLRGNFQLTEDDIVRLVRFFLPFVNFVLAKAQDIFSGDPLRTLKIAPILLFGAKYGHLLTLWKLVSAGFFLSFTVPKLYSCYSQLIQTKVGTSISWIRETWKSCPRKRFIAATAATLFWNLFSVKTRIFAAFMSMVIFRYHHQQVRQKESESKKEDQPQEMAVEEQGQPQEMVVEEQGQP